MVISLGINDIYYLSAVKRGVVKPFCLSGSTLADHWPWIWPCCAADLNTGLTLLVGLQWGCKNHHLGSPPPRPFHQQHWTLIDFICVPDGRDFIVHAQYTHRFPRVFLVFVLGAKAARHRCITAPRSDPGSEWYHQTRKWQHLISNYVISLKWNQICCSVWSPSNPSGGLTNTTKA